MAIARVTTVWNGFTGAPGYTNHFFDSFGAGDQVNLEVDRVRDFFIAASEVMPDVVMLTVSPEVAFLDEVSGDLIGYAQYDGEYLNIAGKASGSYAAPSGALVQWNTDTIAKGRRLRGRTFIVPMASNQYQQDGTLSNDAISDLNAAGAALIGDGDGPQAVLWSRPVNGSGGSIGPITSFRVPDRVSVLRSRRD